MSDPADHVRQVLVAATAELRAAGARDEALGEWVPARRVFGITREARIQPIGRVWRLGVLLLESHSPGPADSATNGGAPGLWAAGTTTRAVEPRWRNYQSISGEQRRDLRAAAHRSKGVEAGEVVNLGATRIDTDAAALAAASASLVFCAVDGTVRVRWRPGDATGIEFAAYLRERVELLVRPPSGS